MVKTSTKQLAKKSALKGKKSQKKKIPWPFPSVKYTKHRYRNFISDNMNGSTDETTVTLRLNDIRQPYASITAMPLYVRNIFGTTTNNVAIYENAIVTGVKLKFRYINETTSGVRACGIASDDASASGLSAVELSVRDYATPLLLCSSEGGNNIITHTQYIQLNKVVGMSKQGYLDSEDYRYDALDDAPNEIINYYLILEQMDINGEKLKGQLYVDMVFYVKYWGLQLEEETA